MCFFQELNFALFVTILCLGFSCNTVGTKRSNSQAKDLVEDNDLFWFGELPDQWGNKIPSFFKGTCDPALPRTPDYCKSNLKVIPEMRFTSDILAHIDRTMSALPSDEGIALSARPYEKDPAYPGLVADFNAKTRLENDIFVKNSAQLPNAEAAYQTAGGRYFPILNAVDTFQRIIDSANAALAKDPSDSDAKSVLDDNTAAQAPYKSQLPSLKKTFEQAKTEVDRLKMEISDSKKARESSSQKLNLFVEASLQNYKLTSEYRAKQIEREQTKKVYETYKSKDLPNIVARMKRSGMPIQLKNLSKEEKDLWTLFIKPKF